VGLSRSRAGSAAADGWSGSAPRLTRTRTGSRCAPGDLASGLSSWPIFAEVAGFFSKLLIVAAHQLLRLEFANQRQGPAQSHPAALVDREQLALGAGFTVEGRRPPLPGGQRHSDPGNVEQPGYQCPAAGWDLVDHRGHRRPGSRHSRVAQAAGLETHERNALRMTSNGPGYTGQRDDRLEANCAALSRRA
jgi:hypothetical protein